MEIQKLIEIATEIGAESISKELNFIENKMNQANCDLVLPFIGEFSSGKTTLINALTDSKKLETATTPTTASIFEIHFGCDNCSADVFDKNGNATHIDDIAELKNEQLGDSPYILVRDTSKLIPSSTVIVDTPGLSSPDPRHKQTLVKFLPQADGIILVVDVNQSITRSLSDFIKTMKLSNRSIFLVITKCDTKSPSEVDAQKNYIAENCGIDIKYVACVSAINNDLQQLFDMFKAISKDKESILRKVNEQRLEKAAIALKTRIDEMLQSSSTDKELDQAINEQEKDLERLDKNIDRLIKESRAEIEEIGWTTANKFEDAISQRLNSIAASKGKNFDAEALSAINTTAALVLSEYKDKVRQLLNNKAKHFNDMESLNIQSLHNIDMSNINISKIEYNIDLNEMGHEHDKQIKVGLIAAAAIGIALVAPTALGAAGAEATTVGGMSVGEAAIEATEITMIAKSASRNARIQRNINAINSYDNQYGQQIGQSNGIISSVIGLVTDSTMGKPQRKKAISDYINSTLLPSFNEEMNRICNEITNFIDNTMHNEAASTISEKRKALQELLNKQRNDKAEFEKRINQLKKFRDIL